MTHVNVYTASGIKSVRPSDGYIAYVLETAYNGKVSTKAEVAPVQHMTANQSELQALIMAVSKLNRPCELTIYTDSAHTASGYTQGWVDTWTVNGWISSRGDEVHHRKEWQELTRLLSDHDAGTSVSRKTCRNVKKRRYRKCLINSENLIRRRR